MPSSTRAGKASRWPCKAATWKATEQVLNGSKHHHVAHRGQLQDRSQIAGTVGDHGCRRGSSSRSRSSVVASSCARVRVKRQVLMPRSMRRPMSMKRQPAVRFMFSLARTRQGGRRLRRAVSTCCKASASEDRRRVLSVRPFSRLSSRVQEVGRAGAVAQAGGGAAGPGAQGSPRPRTTSASSRARRAAIQGARAQKIVVKAPRRSAAPGVWSGFHPPHARRHRHPSGLCRGCARGAAWLRRAQDSGRARTDCRRRDWAGDRGYRRTLVSSRLASRLTRSTGPSAITQNVGRPRALAHGDGLARPAGRRCGRTSMA